MKHEEIKDLLSDYHDGILADPERIMVTGHLAGCQGCRAELACYVQGEELIRSAKRPATGFEVETAVSAVLRRVEPAPEIAWISRLMSSPRWAVPAFTMAFAALFAVMRAPRANYGLSEAVLISQDGGRTYSMITSAPEALAAESLGMEAR
jgi:anti-sigma factor RsiW